MEMIISRVRVDQVRNGKELGHVDGSIHVTLISSSWVNSPPCVLRCEQSSF